MTINAPAAATADKPGLLDKVSAFIATAREKASDGLTWGEFGELVLSLLRVVVPFLESVKLMSGPEKKAFAMDAVGRLFDAVADYAVPVPLYPIWLVARPAVRALVVAIAGGVLEQYLAVLRGV
jgi:hypothetical protein